ncbi:MAG: hypothetical protein HC892_02915 [Saprospiraceae bacterium]|nr:hypothetical protein [Saprospiraceae bacterium]
MEFEQIKNILSELAISQKELTEKMKETDEQMKRSSEDLKARMNQTDEQMRRSSEDLKARMSQTDEQMRRTDKKLESLIGNWDSLIENLSEVGVVEELERFGITGLRESLSNLKVKDGDGRVLKEFDYILINSDVLVVVEAKTTLRTQDVEKHINDLPLIFKSKVAKDIRKVYGVIVYLNAHDQTIKYAEREGIFVIKISGEGILKTQNQLNFMPYNFVKS